MATTPYQFANSKTQETQSAQAGNQSLFKCLFVTPEGKVFEDQTQSLVAPGKEGVFGILANHAPFSALLKKGIISLTKNNQVLRFEIGSGILEVSVTHEVLILCDYAKLVSPTTEAAISNH